MSELSSELGDLDDGNPSINENVSGRGNLSRSNRRKVNVSL